MYLSWEFYENIAALVSSLSKYHQMKFHYSLEENHPCIRGWGYVVRKQINTNIRFSERKINYFIIYTLIKCTGFNCVEAVNIYSTTNCEQKMLFSSSVNGYMFRIIKLRWKVKTYVLQILTFCVGPSAILLLTNWCNNQCGTSKRSGDNGFHNLPKLILLWNVRFETGNRLLVGGRNYSVMLLRITYDSYERN